MPHKESKNWSKKGKNRLVLGSSLSHQNSRFTPQNTSLYLAEGTFLVPLGANFWLLAPPEANVLRFLLLVVPAIWISVLLPNWKRGWDKVQARPEDMEEKFSLVAAAAEESGCECPALSTSSGWWEKKPSQSFITRNHLEKQLIARHDFVWFQQRRISLIICKEFVCMH